MLLGKRLGPLARERLVSGLVLLVSLLPILSSCNWSEDAQQAGEKVKDFAGKNWVATRDKATGAWKLAQDKTGDALVVAGETLNGGKEAALDASSAVWLWSQDKATDGWDWITTQATNAKEWASDTTDHVWMVTREKGGRFFMWVKVEAEEGVAWARTALPAGWKMTKDASGKAWVWINEHRVEAAVAAVVVTIVVTALMIEPLTTTKAIVRTAAARATVIYVGKLYGINKGKLAGLDEKQFRAMANVVIEQNGEQILATRGEPAEVGS